MQILAEMADDYAAMVAAGQPLAAAEKYWSDDIVCFEPASSQSNKPAIATGKAAALARLTLWLEGNAMSDVLVDGPFVTGDQFALFIDMEITRCATGKREPFSEIAVYKVRGEKIIEERFFFMADAATNV